MTAWRAGQGVKGDASEQEKEEKLKITYLTWGDKRRGERKQMVCGREKNTANVRKLQMTCAESRESEKQAKWLGEEWGNHDMTKLIGFRIGKYEKDWRKRKVQKEAPDQYRKWFSKVRAVGSWPASSVINKQHLHTVNQHSATSMLRPIAAVFYTQQQSRELLSAGAGGLHVSLQHPALLNQASGYMKMESRGSGQDLALACPQKGQINLLSLTSLYTSFCFVVGQTLSATTRKTKLRNWSKKGSSFWVWRSLGFL